MLGFVKKNYIIIFLVIIIIILVINKYNINHNEHTITDTTARDFIRYECKNRVRIGGYSELTKKAKSNLWRIDGAWFVCLDDQFKMKFNSCTLFSFGINHDYTFDSQMKNDYGCKIYSFDPFNEAGVFADKRKMNKSLKNSFEIKVDEKWTFYRIGLVGNVNSIVNENKIGWLATLDQILDLTSQRNKIIDVFKMDIEEAEKDFIQNLDMNYACKYLKQFLVETHFYANSKGREAYELIKKLETCFRLFHRDTRFFMHDTEGDTGHLTEFQNPSKFKLEMKEFKTELDLAFKMFSTGELYFINKNFL